MKCGPLKIVCSTFAVRLPFIALSIRETMIGSGKPMIKPMIQIRNVFFISGQNIGSEKNRSKFWNPTQMVESDRILSPGMKSWNAISTP